VKLLLDEMYAPAVALELRGRRHDAVSVHDAASRRLACASDPEVLSAARAEDRALVTENIRDFRPLEADLIARGEHHPGLVYTSNRQFPRGHPATSGQLVRALDALLREDRDLRDRAIFLKRADS
jgi:predicted nuclease of predicted toxin-antitoxin system